MNVVFVCGRMNPPTLGHEKLITEMRKIADREGAVAMVFLTRTHDDRNPLRPEEKVRFVSEAFSVMPRLTASPYSAVDELISEGFTRLVFVLGEDRVSRFAPLVDYAAKSGAKLVIHGVGRPADAVSATQARAAVMEGDRMTFRKLTPSPKRGFQQRLYRAVERGMTGE